MSKLFHISSASLPIIAAVLVLTLSAGYFTLAWTEPSGTMPVTVSAPLNTGSVAQTKTGSLTIGCTLSVQGSDFVIGTNDGRSAGSTTTQRALVHGLNDTLHLNYLGDFEGGTVIGGPTTTVSGSFCVGSTCVSTSTWTDIVNNGGGSASDQPIYGDGFDGDVTIAADTVLTSDKYYNNLTINSGKVLNPNGYRIFVKETLINNGTIRRNGNNGGNGAAAYTIWNGAHLTGAGGAAGAALSDGSVAGSVIGGAGGSLNDSPTVGFSGTAKSYCLVNHNGSNGGNGGKGGDVTGHAGQGGFAGGTGGVTTMSARPPHNAFYGFFMTDFSNLASLVLYQTSASSAGGGAGGAGGSSMGQSAAGGGGGGAGSGGGIIFVAAKKIINNGVIEVNGGNGGNGGIGANGDWNSDGWWHAGGGGGGGGGGGNGGYLMFIYNNLVNAGTIQTLGGIKGIGGASGTGFGGGDGVVGTGGIDGSAGAIVYLKN